LQGDVALKALLKAQEEKTRSLREVVAMVLEELRRGVELEQGIGPVAARVIGEKSSGVGAGGLVAFPDARARVPEAGPRLLSILQASCLLPLLEQHILGSSFVEMERQADLYSSLFQIMQVILENEALHPLFQSPNARDTSLIDFTGAHILGICICRRTS
jgi:hypothetical protein